MNIKVILSKSAKEFVTPLSVASLSKNKVYDNEFTLNNEIEMDHIALSRWADLVMICPATANMISRDCSRLCKRFNHNSYNGFK